MDFSSWTGSCPPGMIEVGKCVVYWSECRIKVNEHTLLRYPFNTPYGTDIPGWALLDTSRGTFDVSAAQSVVDGTSPDQHRPSLDD